VNARTAFAVSVATYVVLLAVAALELPTRVPVHFGTSGGADRWAGRTEAVVTFGLLGLLVGGIFGLFGALGDRVPLALVSVPHKRWWTADAHRTARLRGLLRTDMYWFGATTLAFLGVVVVLTVRAANLADPHLDGWFAVTLGVYLASVAGYLWYCWTMRYRPEPEG